MGEISNALLAVTVAASTTFGALPACAQTAPPADAAPPVSMVVSELAPQSASCSPQRPPPDHTLSVSQTAVPPVLDGALDDAACKSSVISDHFWISEQQRWPSEQTDGLVTADGRASSAKREPLGPSYALDVAGTQTELQPNNRSRAATSLGWTRDFWLAGVKADRYGPNFHPANGLLDRDLPDTRGATPFLTYYKDVGAGPLREIKGDMALTTRNTDDGRQQRLTSYGGGSIESRAQVRAGLWYTDGPYRPVGPTPGSWSDTLNHDRYWTGAVDFNTRSSRFAYGAAGSSGALGGGDYAYVTSYAWARPTATTFVMGTSEHLSNFGTSTQTAASAGWDVTNRQSIVGRYVNASYGKAYRLAYSQNVRKNVDFFLAYDRQPAQVAAVSAKIVMAFQ